ASTSMADGSLAAALRAGDPGAAREAWRLLSPLVQGILGRFFGACPEREDLCQEVFLRFFSRIAEVRDPRALRNFLVGICLGVAQNARRRAQVRRAIDIAPADEVLDRPVAPADLEAREALARFGRALAPAGAAGRARFVRR